jgi:hypothetical protein
MFEVGFKKNNLVKIVDSMMGSSKTNFILDWMNENPNNKYIYVTPLLSEIGEGSRVHERLNNIVLEIPDDTESTKSDSLLNMLKSGDNIACTHSLYLSMSDFHFTEMAKSGYTVILDEEVNVISSFDRYSSNDMKWLIEKNDISIAEEDGMVSWVGSRESITGKHKYLDFLKYCDSKSLYCTRRSETMAVSQLPIKLFECAKEVIVLTYMFEGNILDCFLRLKGFDVENFDGIVPNKVNKEDIKKLLTVIPPNEKLINYSLSATWYSEANGKQLNDISTYIRSVARTGGFNNSEILWTAPKERSVRGANKSKKLVRPIGYSVYKDDEGNKKSCWIAAQTRATNDYREKELMVHCSNRRPILTVQSYLQDYGQPIDLQILATSELLQWAWRGCIRDGKPMTLAIGSKRMYNFFVQWLDDSEVSK